MWFFIHILKIQIVTTICIWTWNKYVETSCKLKNVFFFFTKFFLTRFFCQIAKFNSHRFCLSNFREFNFLGKQVRIRHCVLELPEGKQLKNQSGHVPITSVILTAVQLAVTFLHWQEEWHQKGDGPWPWQAKIKPNTGKHIQMREHKRRPEDTWHFGNSHKCDS